MNLAGSEAAIEIRSIQVRPAETWDLPRLFDASVYLRMPMCFPVLVAGILDDRRIFFAFIPRIIPATITDMLFEFALVVPGQYVTFRTCGGGEGVSGTMAV